jgi:hypothetical protein
VSGLEADPEWAPPGVDTKRANIARVYDYWLGGTHNFLITVSVHFVGRSQAAERLVLALNGEQASRPIKGFPAVATPHARWHAREVFRAPARTV